MTADKKRGGVKYVCQSCGTLRLLDRVGIGEPEPFRRRVRCTSGGCRGAKREHLPAQHPLTGDWKR